MRTSRFHALDRELYRRAASGGGFISDVVLPRLTGYADHGKLWGVSAAVLALTGRREGRRSATRGVLALSIASAVTNQVAKRLARRPRPDVIALRLRHRARRVPISSSFPSGHAASAAAFAVGVALEWPAAGAVLAPIAGGVAVSRVTTGVHYPSDVVAGAALGAAAAFATTRIWKRPPFVRMDAPVASATVAPASSDGRGVSIVINASSGTAGDVRDRLEARLHAATIVEVAEPAELEETLEKAASSAEILGIAGGDGTVNLAAEIASRTGLPLAVFPAGTLNHLARDLRVSGPDDIVDALRDGIAVRIDLPTIAGRPFLNTASIGVYSEMVDLRERLETRLGKWPAAAVAAWIVLRRTDPVDIEIDDVPYRAWVVFVGNGRYEPSGAAPVGRARLDEGRLDVRIVHAGAKAPRTRFIIGLLTRTLRFSGVYEERTTSALRIRSLNGPLRMARDGETSDAPQSFEIASPSSPSLVVYAPKKSGD